MSSRRAFNHSLTACAALTTTAGVSVAAAAAPPVTAQTAIDPHAEIRRMLDDAIERAANIDDDKASDAIWRREVFPLVDELTQTPPQTVAGAVEQIRWAIRDEEQYGSDGDRAAGGGLRLALYFLEGLS